MHASETDTRLPLPPNSRNVTCGEAMVKTANDVQDNKLGVTPALKLAQAQAQRAPGWPQPWRVWNAPRYRWAKKERSALVARQQSVDEAAGEAMGVDVGEVIRWARLDLHEASC